MSPSSTTQPHPSPRNGWRTRILALRQENKLAASQGKSAASLGWRFVRHHAALLVFRVLADLAGQALMWCLLFVLAAPLLLEAFTASDLSFTPLLTRLVDQVTSKSYLVGLCGAISSALLITWLVEAWTRAAIWVACARRAGVTHLTAKPEARPSSTWSEAAAHTPHVLLWLMLRKLVMFAALLAGGSVYVGLIHLMSLMFLPMAVKMAALLLLYMSGLLYLLLIFSTMEWYPAQWIARRMPASDQDLEASPGLLDAGESLLESARRSLEYPIEIYRLFVHAIRPAIPFLLLSFLTQAAKLFFLDELVIYNLLNLLGWLLDLLSLGVLIGVAMAFRFGSVLFEAHWRGQLDAPATLLSRQRLRQKLLRENRHNPLTKLLSSRPSNSEHLEAQHLIPPNAPHRFDFERVLGVNSPEKEEEEHS